METMWSCRIVNLSVALVIAILPIMLMWLLCASLVEPRNLEQQVVHTPNPAKAKWLSLQDTLVYADPHLAGIMPLPLDAAVSFGFLTLMLWSTGMFAKLARSDFEPPRLRWVMSVALTIGLLLAVPLVYAAICILKAPNA